MSLALTAGAMARIAARVGDQLRAGDVFAAQLRQAVDGLLDQLGVGMVDLVPVPVLGNVLESEVGADVHRANAVRHHRAKPFGAGYVGKRRDHHVHAIGQVLGDSRVDCREVREDLAELPAGGASTGDRGDLDFWVSRKYPRKLYARVSRYVDDACLDH